MPIPRPQAIWGYLRYLHRHKLAVYRAGRLLGVGRMQLLVHDLSKFRPDEFFPYAESFYGGPHRPWSEVSGYAKREHFDWAWATSKEGVREAFDRAWLLHQHRNAHHWQSHVLRNDNGTTVALEMPHHYMLEMVADWCGAGMAINGHGLDAARAETRAWYEKNRDRMLLGTWTRSHVERVLGVAGSAPTV